MEPLEKIEGVFTPKRIDNLREGVDKFIGKKMTFEVLWHMDNDDPYPGQHALMPIGDDGEWWHLGWIPEEDISESL